MSASAMRLRGIVGIEIMPCTPRDSLNEPADFASRHAGGKPVFPERRR